MMQRITKNMKAGLAMVSLGGTVVVSVGILLAAGLRGQPESQADTQPETPIVSSAAVRFIALDVFVDAGEDGLAAWQVEYEGSSDAGEGGGVLLVGIEGGEHAAYASPAHYDPEALAGGRVILAAYSTSNDLPSGPTRIARLHLQVPAIEADSIQHAITLIAAGDEESNRLSGRAWVQPSMADTQTNPNETTDEETDGESSDKAGDNAGDNAGGGANSTGDDT